ncbi:hypothetical protein AYL99_08782 [Fonsecaea erecta]|uniref:Uncharacterized protein n=1 Tax=Fonsecaea erecta TaxID=1367422 RepID=A0A178ZA75_9EURO|nr:hypothetical protein AYL99_08782 [Fonsecaea erecta]OAP56670.1 hypothetical protein AYL99_08782 [Fonsecaea erecta]
MPVLPGRLRLSDSDDGLGEEHGEDWRDDEEDEEEDDTDELDDARQRGFSDGDFHRAAVPSHARRTGRRGARGGHDAYDPPAADHEHAAAAEAEADEERRDRERIERLLRDMMARQRARAKGKASASAAAMDEDDEAEKDELMGLIMGSLRREVAKAEDEAWMFGESLGLGGRAGRDEVGVYD